MESIILFQLFVTTLAGLFSILISFYKFFKFLQSERKEIKSFLKLLAFLLMGVVMCISVYLTYSSIKEKEEVKEQSWVRYELTSYRDKLYNILSKYNEIFIENNGEINRSEVIKLLEKAITDYNRLRIIKVKAPDYGLHIYKYDHLSYFSIIISSLESFLEIRENAISWADTVLDSSQVALDYISEIEFKVEIEKNNHRYKTLLSWIKDEGVYFRLRYLRAWAYAIKLYEGDNYTTPQNIVDEIESIEDRSRSYLEKFPLSENPDFVRIKERMNEEFNRRYFGD